MTLSICIGICQKHLASVHFFSHLSSSQVPCQHILSLNAQLCLQPPFTSLSDSQTLPPHQANLDLTCAFPLVSKPSDSLMASPISFSVCSTSFTPSFPIFLSLLVYASHYYFHFLIFHLHIA